MFSRQPKPAKHCRHYNCHEIVTLHQKSASTSEIGLED